MNETQNDLPNTPFEVFLTAEQLKIIQCQLPKGFSLQFSNKPYRREKTPKLKKKMVLEDPTPQFSHSHFSNSASLSYKPAKKVKTVPHPNENSAASFTTNTNDSSYKRSSLREKKFTNFDHKYADFENTQLSSGFNASTANMNISKNLTESMRKCLKIISLLKKHQFSFPFLKPVDPQALQVPDYFDIVKEPMDLGTVERNLRNGLYGMPSQFSSDVRKIWNNSFLYNAKGSDIYHMTITMSNYFEKLFSEVESNTGSETYIELHKKVEKLTKEIKELHTKNPNPNSKQHKTVNQINEKPMTLQEKRNLGQNIRNLPAQYLRGVWEIVNDGVLNQHKEELEFDIDTLPVKKCRDLERYVNTKLALIRKNENKDNKSKGKFSDKKSGKKMEVKNENEKKFFNENNNFGSNNLINSQIINRNTKQEIYENQLKETGVQPIMPMPIENLPNLHSFEVFNNTFPVKNIEVLEYPTDEKKAQTTNFNAYNNEALKSSDSSFITDSEDSMSDK